MRGGQENENGRVLSASKEGGIKDKFSWAERGKWVYNPGLSKVVGKKWVRKIWQLKRVMLGSPKNPFLASQYKGAKSGDGNGKILESLTLKESGRVKVSRS